MLAWLAGCSAEVTVQPEAPYQPITDTKEFMNWILDPSADVIWGASGYIVTAEGTEDLTSLALDLGFSSHSHFSTAFRRQFGRPPSAMRRALRTRDLDEMSRMLKA